MPLQEIFARNARRAEVEIVTGGHWGAPQAATPAETARLKGLGFEGIYRKVGQRLVTARSGGRETVFTASQRPMPLKRA